MRKFLHIKELFKTEKRVRVLAILGVLGILLLGLSELLPNPRSNKSAKEPKSQTETKETDFVPKPSKNYLH